MHLESETEQRLDRCAAALKISPRMLAERYLEEGIRMDEHPLIFFIDGPTGRRAVLRGTGADVWEVMATVKDNDGHGVVAAARYLDLPVSLVKGAAAYHAAFPEEINARIESNQNDSQQAEAAYLDGPSAK